MTAEGQTRLVDFDVAQEMDETGRVFGGNGTEGFMAPESTTGKRLCTAAVDIFSLGKTLEELIPLKASYDGELESNLRSLIHSMCAEDPESRISIEDALAHPALCL